MTLKDGALIDKFWNVNIAKLLGEMIFPAKLFPQKNSPETNLVFGCSRSCRFIIKEKKNLMIFINYKKRTPRRFKTVYPNLH